MSWSVAGGRWQKVYSMARRGWQKGNPRNPLFYPILSLPSTHCRDYQLQNFITSLSRIYHSLKKYSLIFPSNPFSYHSLKK